MKIKQLILLTVIFICSAVSCFSQSVDENVIAEVPFTLSNGQILIEATINKKLTVKLILSNTFSSSIDITKLDENKIRTTQKMYPNGVSGTFTPQATVNGIKIGDMSVPGLDMYWDGAMELAREVKEPVDGILGYDFMDNRIIQIDFPKNVVRFLRKNPLKETIKNKSEIPDGKAVLKLKVSTGTPPKPITMMTTEDILVNGKTAKTLFNLNQTSPFIISYDKRELKAGNNSGASLKIGKFELKNIAVSVEDIGRESKKYEAALGSAPLRDCVVTLDLRDNIIILEK